MELEFKKFARKPFIIDAVEITAENIEEVAKYVGELKKSKDGPYILVDRTRIPSLVTVQLGYFMTRKGDHIRCYKRNVFLNQFELTEDQINLDAEEVVVGGTDA